MQENCIEEIRKKFSGFGVLERVEIFKKKFRFAHVTFKNSLSAYLTLLYFEKHSSELYLTVRLASIYDQPDKPDKLSTISVLPNELLIKIFEKINNIHDQVSLLATCKRFSTIIKEMYIDQLKEVEYSGRCAENAISTACNLLKYYKPKGYKFSVETKKNEIERYSIL